jgi:glycosyltransferase involved in cell wall biosynthesis
VNILFLESFYGGSHKAFADGLKSHSRHTIELESLPARFWKWRMRGAALHFVRKIVSPERYDGLIVTDLISLADLKALWAAACPRNLVYYHENQLSYPLPPGEKMDYQFGFTDITTALSADRILFNSRSHREAFLSRLPAFLRMMPEHRPLWVVDEIRRKSAVLYPGCDFHPAALEESGKKRDPSASPLVIWNHRWEFDKDPDAFFRALEAAARRGLDFRVALLGETFQAVPKAFISAKRTLGKRIVQYGYEPSRQIYARWLAKGDIVVSTAVQENFGLSIVEAIRYGCIPLLPKRLSYPELIPRRFHRQCLYEGQEELETRLCSLISSIGSEGRLRRELAGTMDRFSWTRRIEEFDGELDALQDA